MVEMVEMARLNTQDDIKENDKNKLNQILKKSADSPQKEVPIVIQENLERQFSPKTFQLHQASQEQNSKLPPIILANELICLPSLPEPSENDQLSALKLDHCYSFDMEINFDSLEGFYAEMDVDINEGESKNRC